MKAMEDLKKMICKELEEISKKGEMSAGDLDAVFKLVVAKEKLMRAEQIESEMGQSEWSGSSYGSYARGSYGGGNSMSSYGDSYGDSYARGYSRDSDSIIAEGPDMVMDHMRRMINSPNLSQSERMTVRRAMERMQAR